MKYLDAMPPVRDKAILRSLAKKRNLASFPHLNARLNDILAQYEKYWKSQGNPWGLNAPVPIPLSEALIAALELHYEKPPNALAHITKYKHEGSANACPMCGNLTAATSDHLFPRSVFPEFCIFSKNLVPACECNSKRGTNYKGTRPGERVLHPYFDSRMKERLVRAKLSASVVHGYRCPIIDIEPCISSGDPLYIALNYHIENVIRKTNVIYYFKATWPGFIRTYSDYFILPSGTFSDAIFDDAVDAVVGVHDRRRSTPNNWDSMLLAGLAANSDAKAYVLQKIREIRAGTIRADEI